MREQLKELRNDEENKKERNKQDRIEASIKQREEEVRAKKEEIDRERQLERGVHLQEKAVENFKALLADMVGFSYHIYLSFFGTNFRMARKIWDMAQHYNF